MHITSEQKSAVLAALINEGFLLPGAGLVDFRHEAVLPDRKSGELAFSFVIGDQVDQLVSGRFGSDGTVKDLEVTEVSVDVTEALLATMKLLEAERT